MNSVAAKPLWLPWLMLALVASLLAPLLAPQPATAQGTTGNSKLSAIRERMERGQALFVGGNLEAAAEVFDTSYEKHKFPAFLFNAGVCYQKLGDYDAALERFETYLRVTPDAPDRSRVEERIEALKGAIQAAKDRPAAAGAGGALGAGGAPSPGGARPGGAPTEGPAAPRPRLPERPEDEAMKSVVLVETEPSGAPVALYAPKTPSTPAFELGEPNPGWEQVTTTRAPANLTLDVGRYHVVVKKFRDFNPADQEIEVAPGRVLHFVANLSQGAFMSFLRVSANVRGAELHLDDPEKEKPAWGLAPHSELVSAGEHSILVEAPGYEPFFTEFELTQGEQRYIEVELSRVGYGLLRIDANAPQISVEIDEQPVGIWRSGEPPLEVKLAAGKKSLVATSKGRKTFRGTVDIPKGQALPVHVEMIPNYPRGAAWTQAALGAAIVGTSVWLGVESNRLHDQLEEDRAAGVLEDGDARILRGKLFAIGADAGFVVGGLLGVLATHNFLKDPLPESSKKVRDPVEFDTPNKPTPVVAPAASPKAERRERRPQVVFGPSVGRQGAGLVFGGRF